MVLTKDMLNVLRCPLILWSCRKLKSKSSQKWKETFFLKLSERYLNEPESGQHTPREFSPQTEMHLTTQRAPEIKHQMCCTINIFSNHRPV